MLPARSKLPRQADHNQRIRCSSISTNSEAYTLQVGSHEKQQQQQQQQHGTEMEGSIPTHNSLLDPYEIESISKRLDQLIESNGIKSYRELLRIDTDFDDNHTKKKRSSTKLKGFLQRRAVVCGRNHDVEETALRLKNQVAAAKKVNGKQRAADVW
ncbi:hypothetical protein V6N13_140580 [Hibiscus sabdariffa]